MLKKIALTFICVCCWFLFGGCDFNSDVLGLNPDEEYFYEVHWYFQGDGVDVGQSVPDEYSFFYRGKIYVYSVAAQEITQVLGSKDDQIDDYAINDDYIFFTTGEGSVPGRPDAKLWKYDRKTDTCELFTEISWDNWHLELYQGYVFYGGDDVNVCPIDGKPEEDSISLLAQFPEDVSANKMPDMVFQGWHIRRERKSDSDRILFVKDQENGHVILDRESIWVDVNGELIHVNRETAFVCWYQRENEQKKRFFDCLKTDYGSFRLRRDRLGVEEGKIIGLITEYQYTGNPYEVPQNRVVKDILFEIDPEADSCRVIYVTEGSKTRIIGCRGGKLYLLEDDIIYRESLEDGSREKVFDLRDGSVALYRKDGLHADIRLIMWGDNLLVRPAYGTDGMFTIPLSNQAGEGQEERN